LAQIRKMTSGLPFALPREVETLYQWRDGTMVRAGDRLDKVYFFPGFYLLSLEEAVQTYAERRDAPQWRPEWFPLFANGGGDFYLAWCRSEMTQTAPIVGFMHGEPEQIVEYESLTAMVRTLAACYDSGAFFLDEDNTLEVDDEMHRQLALRFNPGIEEWQE
jgi:cell wall assembly regulator SMI1